MVIDFLGGKSCAVADKASRLLRKQRLKWRSALVFIKAFVTVFQSVMGGESFCDMRNYY
jgi:hypothetical protein